MGTFYLILRSIASRYLPTNEVFLMNYSAASCEELTPREINALGIGRSSSGRMDLAKSGNHNFFL